MKIAPNDDFEHIYMQKFRVLASSYGEFVEYERDRAARDIGLHFTQTKGPAESKIVTPALAWFQMKSIRESKLPFEDYQSDENLKISIETKHLVFWHLCATPTYLVIYVESADIFHVLNVKRKIEEDFGTEILQSSQRTHTITMSKQTILDEGAFKKIMTDNLLTELRAQIEGEDEEAQKFLRDSEIIRWLSLAETDDQIKIRAMLIKYMSKTRTEVHFQRYDVEEEEWVAIREHWQYMLRDIDQAFPYLELSACNKVEISEDGEWEDAEEIDPECLFELPNGEISIAGHHVEIFAHYLNVSLNSIGRSWANTLTALENAEVIAVDMSPKFLSVAPWHDRGL